MFRRHVSANRRTCLSSTLLCSQSRIAIFDGGMVRQIVEASILRCQLKTARIDSVPLMR
jgi:hypothetical protein